MTTQWIAHQLLSLADSRPGAPQVPRFNPRPAGVVRPGSATDAVLACLVSKPHQWLSHSQLLAFTGRSTKAVCWALIFLRSQGLVEGSADIDRNARYLKYRLTPEGMNYAERRANSLVR